MQNGPPRFAIFVTFRGGGGGGHFQRRKVDRDGPFSTAKNGPGGGGGGVHFTQGGGGVHLSIFNGGPFSISHLCL